MKNLFAFFELILYGSIFFGGLVAQRESAVEDLVFPKTFHLKSWKAIIYPLSLKIYGQKDNGPLILIGSAKENEFNDPIHVHDTENSMEILYPHMKVRISSKEDRVHFHFELEKSCDIAWPVSGVDPHNKLLSILMVKDCMSLLMIAFGKKDLTILQWIPKGTASLCHFMDMRQREKQ